MPTPRSVPLYLVSLARLPFVVCSEPEDQAHCAVGIVMLGLFVFIVFLYFEDLPAAPVVAVDPSV